MGVGRSPFIHCSQRRLFWELGGPSSLQDAEAGLSGAGGCPGSVEAIPPCHRGGTLVPASPPALAWGLFVSACFLSGCCKVIK